MDWHWLIFLERVDGFQMGGHGTGSLDQKRPLEARQVHFFQFSVLSCVNHHFTLSQKANVLCQEFQPFFFFGSRLIFTPLISTSKLWKTKFVVPSETQTNEIKWSEFNEIKWPKQSLLTRLSLHILLNETCNVFHQNTGSQLNCCDTLRPFCGSVVWILIYEMERSLCRFEGVLTFEFKKQFAFSKVSKIQLFLFLKFQKAQFFL